MKELYRHEKKRIGLERWAVLVNFLVIYFCVLQRKASYIIWDELENQVLPYNLSLLCILGIFFVTYLNRKLFFIKEQVKTIYLLKKYEIVPIRKIHMYQIRIRIMAEMILVFVAGSLAVYSFAVKSNYIAREGVAINILTEGMALTPKVVLLLCVMVITVVAVIFGLDAYQEKKG